MDVMVTHGLLYQTNSMKTHRLKHRHDRRREKRYVVVPNSLINQTI